VIVVLGKQAAKVVRNEFDTHGVNMFGPQLISNHQRYIVFLPHPNAHVPRTFENAFDQKDLQELRDFLRQK
jgi:uracil-DNA glycosylase